MRERAVETLFALFTSAKRAEAMAGDLVEERDRQGWTWLCLHTVRVTLALWRIAVMEAPLRVLALTVAGFALFAVPAFAGVAAVSIFPQWIESPLSWLAMSSIWWAGALWTGASLSAMAPRHGMTACATLASASEALVMGLGISGVWRELWYFGLLQFCTTGLVMGVLLLVGGALGRWRTSTGGFALSEQG